MDIKENRAILFAILAAALYAISSPVSKLLLAKTPPAYMASFLYLGAGAGMSVVNLILHGKNRKKAEARLTRQELPFIIGMVILDIAAPIFLMIGLTSASAANASLLNNFEIAATALIALAVFREPVSKRLWVAIGLITVSCMILSIEDVSSFTFSAGSIFVLLACICWGIENNCTRNISLKDPLEVVIIKGFGSGTGSLLVALILGEKLIHLGYIAAALVLGFFSYGLSIFFYIYAQRDLGAARTSAYYAVAPFIGAGISLAVFRELPSASFWAAFAIMIFGMVLASTEMHDHQHTHMLVTHEHKHSHDDGHHNHVHSEKFTGKHSHVHTHEEVTHSHKHTQDIHHMHAH